MHGDSLERYQMALYELGENSIGLGHISRIVFGGFLSSLFDLQSNGWLFYLAK